MSARRQCRLLLRKHFDGVPHDVNAPAEWARDAISRRVEGKASILWSQVLQFASGRSIACNLQTLSVMVQHCLVCQWPSNLPVPCFPIHATIVPSGLPDLPAGLDILPMSRQQYSSKMSAVHQPWEGTSIYWLMPGRLIPVLPMQTVSTLKFRSSAGARAQCVAQCVQRSENCKHA